MDLLIEIFLEAFAELIFELLGEAALHALGVRRPTSRWIAYVGCLVLGSLTGLAATRIFPEPVLVRKITGISVLLSPLLAASLMSYVGRKLAARAIEPGTLATFSGAWLFATAFSLCRLWILIQ